MYDINPVSFNNFFHTKYSTYNTEDNRLRNLQFSKKIPNKQSKIELKVRQNLKSTNKYHQKSSILLTNTKEQQTINLIQICTTC